MDSVNQTLYIPLYGKAFVSQKGILLHDPMAETLWAQAGITLKAKSSSKWLAYYMAMRAVVFDRWVLEQLQKTPDAVVVQIGCGLDSRCLRVNTKADWYDVDFPAVIAERARFYPASDTYHMIGADATDAELFELLPRNKQAIVVMEGVSMYLPLPQLKLLLRRLAEHFSQAVILMDCYTEFAAKASKYKNPINDVGVTEVFGLNDPRMLEADTGFSYLREHEMTPDDLIEQLQGAEKPIFRVLYAGSIAKSMYRLYEYHCCDAANN